MTQEDGFTYLCTGTLLNDSLVEQHAVFLFGEPLHRFGDWRRARSTRSGSSMPSRAAARRCRPIVQQASGAAMLARSADWDWALVRLNAAPPAGSRFSAWRAEPIPNGATVSVIHHPAGRPEEVEPGDVAGLPALHRRLELRAGHSTTQGTTEPGSSGAGLLTFLATAAATTKCAAGLWTRRRVVPTARRHRRIFAARQHAAADAPVPDARHRRHRRRRASPSSSTIAGSIITSSRSARQEIDDLDTGVHRRLGAHRLASSSRTERRLPGASPVCRFYRTPGFGDSHFYSASASECAAVIGQSADVSRLDARELRMCSTSRCPIRRRARALPAPCRCGGSTISGRSTTATRRITRCATTCAAIRQRGCRRLRPRQRHHVRAGRHVMRRASSRGRSAF